LTTGTLAEAVGIEPVATATKVAAVTTPPIRMYVLALVLNLITFSSPSLGNCASVRSPTVRCKPLHRLLQKIDNLT
jgi:hypothetical protein